MIGEVDGEGNLVCVYTCGPNGLLAKQDVSGSYYYHFDGVGSVVAMTNAREEVVNEYRFDAWGNEARTTQIVRNPLRFLGASGYWKEGESGIYLHRIWRTYDPRIGRFLTPAIASSAGNYIFWRELGLRFPWQEILELLITLSCGVGALGLAACIAGYMSERRHLREAFCACLIDYPYHSWIQWFSQMSFRCLYLVCLLLSESGIAVVACIIGIELGMQVAIGVSGLQQVIEAFCWAYVTPIRHRPIVDP